MKLRKAILVLNSAGLLGYCLWLIMGHQRIFYTQAGVLYLLPCLPFFFIYFFLFRGFRIHDDHDPYE